MRKSFLLVLVLFIAGQLVAQKFTVADRIKYIDADDNYEKQYYDAAYKLYVELYSRYPQNPTLAYKTGKCAYNMNKYNEALTYFTHATKIGGKVKGGRDLPFYLGRTQQLDGMLDEALVNYNKFRSTLKGKAQKTDMVNDYIFQIERAKKFIANPVNAVVVDLGSAINTEYIESNPSVSADGTMMIFTTCRPENTGGGIDPVYNIYYQDIWVSYKDSVTGKWLDAEKLPGEINTKEHDACTSLSPDGNYIFIYKSVNGGDIYFSKMKKNGEWKAPEPVAGKINTSYFETSACMSADKKSLFFISEKIEKSQGNGDVWMATKKGTMDYENPVNLGSLVNSIDDESSVCLHPNGKTIFYSSNGKYSIGGYDILKSDYVNGKWTEPINLGYPINTLGDEKHFTISADGTKAYLTSKREDSKGNYDIYEVDLTNYLMPDKDGNHKDGPSLVASISIIKGKVLDNKDGSTLEAKVKITDANGNVQEVETNDSGEFSIVVDGGQNYTIEIKEDGFKTYTETVFVKSIKGRTEVVNKAILLVGE